MILMAMRCQVSKAHQTKLLAARAKGIPGAVANTPPSAVDLNKNKTAAGGAGDELRSQSSSESKKL